MFLSVGKNVKVHLRVTVVAFTLFALLPYSSISNTTQGITANDLTQLDRLVELYRVTDFTDVNQVREARRLVDRYMRSLRSRNLDISRYGKGFELLAQHRKAESLMQLDASIRISGGRCRDSDREILQRLQMAAAQQDSCEVYRNTPLRDLHRSLSDITSRANVPVSGQDSQRQTFSAIKEEAIRTTVETYLSLDWHTGGVAPRERDVEELCRSVPGLCTQQSRRAGFVRTARAIEQSLKGRVGPSSQLSAARLNEELRALNTILARVPVGTTEGYIWDSPDINEGTRAVIDEYIREYNRVASFGVGVLLRTDTLRERAGGPRLLDKPEKDESGRFRYPAHNASIGMSDLTRARMEAKQKMLNRLRELNAATSAGDTSENLKDLVRSSPVAVARALLNDPSRFNDVCSAIAQIQREDQNDVFGDKLSFGGGIVAGAAGVVALGAAGAAYVFTAPVSVPLTVVAGAAGGVSLVTGAGVAAYESYEGYEAYVEQKSLQASLLSRTGDSESAREMTAAYEKYNEAVRNAVLNGVVTATGMGAVAGAARAWTVAQRAGELRRLTKSLNEAADIAKNNPQVSRMFETLSRSLNSRELGLLHQHLATVESATRAKFLENLSKMSPDDYLKVLKSMLC